MTEIFFKLPIAIDFFDSDYYAKRGAVMPDDTSNPKFPQKKRSELITHEDYWSIWIGFFLIFLGMAIYLPNPPENAERKIASLNETLRSQRARAKDSLRTLAWHEANFEKEKIKATSRPIGKYLGKLLSKPQGWKRNPLDAFFMSSARADDIAKAKKGKYAEALAEQRIDREEAEAALAKAENAGFENPEFNAAARQEIEDWVSATLVAKAAEKKIPDGGYNQIGYLILLALGLAIRFGIGMVAMQGEFFSFLKGFGFVFAFAVLAYLAAGQATMKELGFGYAIWAILFGLIISNTIGTPNWVKPAVQTEYFIKTGLVLLGVEVLFEKILQIGLPGLMVAWIVTPTVIIVSYNFGKKILKGISDQLNITMSAAVSVCGVSAAIATAAACKAKKEELTLAVGLSLIFTAIMMVVMPAFIKLVGMTEILGGAWMGGVIDSTGAVAAAGAFLGPKALYVSATIKMIQNVLIGLVAFVVAIVWAMKSESKATGTKPNAMEIWYRFPKFVLGFAAASILASAVSAALGSDMSYSLLDNGVIRGFTKDLRGWMFCLAFVSIGLSTNFRELSKHFGGGKPFWLYIFGQTFNLLLTLLIARIAFYVLFPMITAGI